MPQPDDDSYDNECNNTNHPDWNISIPKQDDADELVQKMVDKVIEDKAM